MTEAVTCLHCQHWGLRDNPTMSRLGFAVCKRGKGQMYTTTSGHYPRICLRFELLPEADVQKRVDWLDRQRSKPC